jgi:hypothetical protein
MAGGRGAETRGLDRENGSLLPRASHRRGTPPQATRFPGGGATPTIRY